MAVACVSLMSVWNDYFDEQDWPLLEVADRDVYESAVELVEQFGPAADIEAATRAHASREKGNYLGVCLWRRVERFIPVLTGEEMTGTLH